MQYTVLRGRCGATSGSKSTGCTRDQEMVAAQGSVRRPPHSQPFIHEYEARLLATRLRVSVQEKNTETCGKSKLPERIIPSKA